MLFPPSDGERLEYAARRKGTLTYEWPNTFARKSVSDFRVQFSSSVNLSAPDHKRHAAALRGCAPRRCTLRAGETLFLPAWWHHEVRSSLAPPGKLNLAVNFWFRNTTAPPQGM